MTRRRPGSTLSAPLFPYPTLFLSGVSGPRDLAPHFREGLRLARFRKADIQQADFAPCRRQVDGFHSRRSLSVPRFQLVGFGLRPRQLAFKIGGVVAHHVPTFVAVDEAGIALPLDRKSTRLNSSH